MGENPANHVFVDWNAKAICCAIRGQPQLGLRCFISTTARTILHSVLSGRASVGDSVRIASVLLLAHGFVKG
jgi:hypothetical protein